MKRTPQERIFASHMAIAKHPEFSVFSGLTVCGESKVDNTKTATACTDGWNKYYNSDFMDKRLPLDKHLRFVVLHELIHQAFNHLGLWKRLHDENPQLANLAADYFVNDLIIQADPTGAFAAMPVDENGKNLGVHDIKYRGWSVLKIYEDLKQQGGDEGGEGGEGGGLDDHEWKSNGNAPDDATDQIDVALRQGKELSERLKQQQGTGSGNGTLDLNNLLYPKKNWRELLREFISSHCNEKDEATWRKPNRRHLMEDMYMPSLQGFRPYKFGVVVDTSGSVFSNADAQRFISELSSIVDTVKPEYAVVAYADTKVVSSQVFEDGNFHISGIKYAGGGGTDLETAYQWFEENRHGDMDCCVFLTDGFTTFTKPPKYPVLWAMITDVVAPYGITCRIED